MGSKISLSELENTNKEDNIIFLSSLKSIIFSVAKGLRNQLDIFKSDIVALVLLE